MYHMTAVLIHTLSLSQDFGDYSELFYSVQTPDGEAISQVLVELMKKKQISVDSPSLRKNDAQANEFLQVKNTGDKQANPTVDDGSPSLGKNVAQGNRLFHVKSTVERQANLTVVAQDGHRFRTESLNLQTEVASQHPDIVVGSSKHVVGELVMSWTSFVIHCVKVHFFLASICNSLPLSLFHNC